MIIHRRQPGRAILTALMLLRTGEATPWKLCSVPLPWRRASAIWKIGAGRTGSCSKPMPRVSHTEAGSCLVGASWAFLKPPAGDVASSSPGLVVSLGNVHVVPCFVWIGDHVSCRRRCNGVAGSLSVSGSVRSALRTGKRSPGIGPPCLTFRILEADLNCRRCSNP